MPSYKLGVNAYVVKPVDFHACATAIKGLGLFWAVINEPPPRRVHPEDVGRVKAELALHREGRMPHFENEHRVWHADGSYRWMLSRGIAVRGAAGVAYRIAGSQIQPARARRGGYEAIVRKRGLVQPPE